MTYDHLYALMLKRLRGLLIISSGPFFRLLLTIIPLNCGKLVNWDRGCERGYLPTSPIFVFCLHYRCI